MRKKKPIPQQLAEKTFEELGLDSQGKLIKDSPKFSYVSPKSSSSVFPFRIKALEKTKRQSPKGKAYRYSALYRNAVTLRLLVKKFTDGLDSRTLHRLISQLNSSGRSVVANIREGYVRPTTKEYSTFLGYSHGSLEEIRGDIVDAKDDGLLPTRPGSTLAKIGIILKPHPLRFPKISSRSPRSAYDPLREVKSKIGEVRREQLTSEIFIELVNKTDWLLKRAIEGLDRKIVSDEKRKLRNQLNAHWRKNW